VSNIQCAACYRANDAFLCTVCADLLAKELRTVGWISDELDVTLSRQDRIGVQQGGHKPGKEVERPLPYNVGASEAGWILHDVLAVTARDLAEQRGIEYLPDGMVSASFIGPLLPGLQRIPANYVDSSPSIAAWLARHVDAIRHDEGGGQTYDELTDAIASARRIIDAPAGRIFAGPCGSETDAGRCGADLYAAVDAPSVSCQECGAKWDAGERQRDLLAQARDRLGTAIELERLLPWFLGAPIRADRIRQWAKRGQVKQVESSDAGDPRYAIGEIVDMHHRVAAKCGGKRAS